jgi:HEXXH motif-containing protein
MFIPEPNSPALRLDQAMRDDLATSLERLAERASAVLPAEVDTTFMVQQIRSHGVLPGVFARYYDLITALQKQDWPAAARLWREISRWSARPADVSILPFDADTLGDDAERYQRLFSTGQTVVPQFARPDEAALASLRRTVPAALDLLEAAHAAWAAEVRALITQVVAFAPPDRGAGPAYGGSSMMVWGGIVVNIGMPPDRLEVLAILAHEATHQLLFGLSRTEPLVLNPVSERFGTPLRPIPRPLNAVFHSTYVSGRIHMLFEMLLQRLDLQGAELTWAQETSCLQRDRFQQGCDLIMDKARLTPLGRRLIEEARGVIAGQQTPIS